MPYVVALLRLRASTEVLVGSCRLPPTPLLGLYERDLLLLKPIRFTADSFRYQYRFKDR